MAEFHNKNAEENGRAPSKNVDILKILNRAALGIGICSFFDILILLDSKWYSRSNGTRDPYPVTKD